jgi:hypothetical protein
MSLDLNKLENKLDEALSNETSETLSKFLNDKRMINNKKLTVVEWLQETLRHNSINIFKGSIEDQAKNLEQVFKQAKEMEYNIFFHWYFTGKNDVKENKSFRQRYNEKYGSNLEENKTNNMKVYRHKLTKAIMSEHDYNHLSSYEQSQMEATDRVTVAELDKMSRDISYWKVKTGDEGKKMTGENNNPDNTVKEKTSKQNNTGKYPVPGQIWKHYKGGQYEIIAMCNHTDTDESLVIYRSLSFGGYHARPYNEWHDEVWVDNHRKTRFELFKW